MKRGNEVKVREWSKQEVDTMIEANESFYLYLYTPLCGTCQVAKKMMIVVNELTPNQSIGMCNLNYIPDRAQEWSVESVPCLVTFHNGEVVDKLYAFKSVEHIYNLVK